MDLVQHRLAGHAEDPGGLFEPDPAVWDVGDDAATKLVGDPNVPGATWRELFAGDEAVVHPAIQGHPRHAEDLLGFSDGDHLAIIVGGCDGRRLIGSDTP